MSADTSARSAYPAIRDELTSELAARREAAGSPPVPACPGWTVKDVVAHLCGLNAEKLAGTPPPLGSDEATARQVGDRASSTLAGIIEEWRGYAERIDASFARDDAFAGALTADLVIHVFDIAEVLGQRTSAASAATPLAARRYVPLLQERVGERLGIALTVELTDDATFAAPGDGTEPVIAVAATSHDFLRGVTGRRTRAEVEALDWSADPGAILDQAWNQYGPFRA